MYTIVLIQAHIASTILRGRLEGEPQEQPTKDKTELELLEMKLQNGVIISSRDAMRAQVGILENGVKDVRSMDVWAAVVAVDGIEELLEKEV